MAASPPLSPKSIPETGLGDGFLMDLLIKNIYRLAQEKPTDMAAEMRVQLPIIEDVLVLAREAKLVQTLGSLGATMAAELRYELTDAGRAWASRKSTRLNSSHSR